MSQTCKALDSAGFWWGKDLIDTGEPDYVKGKGIFIPQTTPCPYVPESGKDLCYKHRFMVEQILMEMAMNKLNEETACEK